ncbi:MULTISPECIES: helix-turn-helix transcriptional regulator [Bacillaceae]|uniref:helix-turn-helix transcriptional regulator n=1 Tax=Bacillaceae TaxID=186817 RepID=UPI001C7DCEB4|nr:helix-turn-helix transcriptional regulator [Bacillus sp. PK3_68]
MKDIEVKNSVKLKRIEKGNLTQSDLAKIVGVTRQTMNLIEAQKYNPTIKVCLLIANALEVSVDQLFWMEE